MEQPAEHDGEGVAEGDVEAYGLQTVERELMRAVGFNRLASGDAWLYADAAARVLARLREVAPDLVAAAEVEVGVRPA